MDYFKSLSLRQWIIVLAIVLFFVASYFFFMRKPVDERKVEIERLMEQGTAPRSSEENMSRGDLEKFLKSDIPQARSDGVAKELTGAEKDALFKLMSAPRPKQNK